MKNNKKKSLFRYRFICTDKENIIYKTEQMKNSDSPYSKTLFGRDLYKSGIHFQECGNRIKGFYIAEGENENDRGLPIRVCFTGRFTEEKDPCFDVYIFPNIFELLLLVSVFISLSVAGKAAGLMMGIFALSFFLKSYYSMMNDTYNLLEEIFSQK